MVHLISDHPQAAERLASWLRRNAIYSRTVSYAEAEDRLTADEVPVVVLYPYADDFSLIRITGWLAEHLPNTRIITAWGESMARDELRQLLAARSHDVIYFDQSSNDLLSAIDRLMFEATGQDMNCTRMERLAIDHAVRRVYFCGRILSLTPSEYAILRFIAINHPHRYRGEDILAFCFDPVKNLTVGNIATHIANLNRKSRAVCYAPIILSERKRGYRINYAGVQG